MWRFNKNRHLCALVLSCSQFTLLAWAGAPADPGTLDRGRYLARIAGCNDCHAPAYPERGGNVPEKQWLTGTAVGWRGPWGTTYPTNLRLYFNTITEEEWVRIAHTKRYRPPMPWFALRDMKEQDLRALYGFITHLGPAGEPAPAYVPPGKTVSGPVVQFPAPAP